eukprot:3416950-Pyramimonas_sp.AAC.1
MFGPKLRPPAAPRTMGAMKLSRAYQSICSFTVFLSPRGRVRWDHGGWQHHRSPRSPWGWTPYGDRQKTRRVHVATRQRQHEPALGRPRAHLRLAPDPGRAGHSSTIKGIVSALLSPAGGHGRSKSV